MLGALIQEFAGVDLLGAFRGSQRADATCSSIGTYKKGFREGHDAVPNRELSRAARSSGQRTARDLSFFALPFSGEQRRLENARFRALLLSTSREPRRLRSITPLKKQEKFALSFFALIQLAGLIRLNKKGMGTFFGFYGASFKAPRPEEFFLSKTKNGGRCFAELIRVRVQGFGMEPPDREACSFELARTLVNAASRDPANAQLSSEGKARAMRLGMCLQRTKKAFRGVGAARISAAAQRAMRYPQTKDLARKWRAWWRRIWFAPPELSAEDPYKWRNLIATAGLSGRAPEKQWGKLLEKLNEIPISALNDLAVLGKDQLHIVPEDP